MKIVKLSLILVVGILSVVASATTEIPPFPLPPRAKITTTQPAGKGWRASGVIAVSFQQAQRGLAVKIASAGWQHLHTISLDKDRVLEAWRRGDDELTVMVWRLAPGRSGFSYGLSHQSKGGK